MHISWGTRIALLYIGFVVLIVSLVAATMFKKVDLVADDYYHQETIFQQRLDAAQASAALSEPLKISTDKNELIIRFPDEFSGHTLSGTVYFYAPSSTGADRTYPLQTTDNRCRINRKGLSNVPYEIQVSWHVSGKEYYQSIPFNLQ